jgi:ribose-phosphate pyrophosphokinase
LKSKVILFAFPAYEALAGALGRLMPLSLGHFSIARFSNGELHATLETAVAGEACLLLGAVAPPDVDLLSTLLLSHTLAKEGAGRITALLPYLGYSRHDRDEPGRSRGTAWLGELLRASGVSDVVSVDVHSRLVHKRFPIPVRSLSPAGIFAEALTSLALRDPTLVAPDEGALERCEAVRRLAGIERSLAYFTKKRTETGIVHSTLHGAVGPSAVLVDDILDTGGTLVSAGEALGRAGVETIIVMVSHGLFTGTSWRRLGTLPVKRIYCTNTLPPPPPSEAPPIEVLSVARLLSSHLNEQTRRLEG